MEQQDRILRSQSYRLTDLFAEIYPRKETMNTLIIEVSGGVVQEVYTNAENLRVVLVDWDAGDSPGEEFAGGKFPTASLSQLRQETSDAVAALSA